MRWVSPLLRKTSLNVVVTSRISVRFFRTHRLNLCPRERPSDGLRGTASLSYDPLSSQTFSSLGIDPELETALDVGAPTHSQRAMLAALGSGRNVISKNIAVSGKSLALALYVANRANHRHLISKRVQSLLLVHNDQLLKQYETNYNFFTAANSRFVYEQDIATSSDFAGISTIITTPATLIQALNANGALIQQLETLSFIGVDEADYLFFDVSQTILSGNKRRHSTIIESLLQYIRFSRKDKTDAPSIQTAFLSSPFPENLSELRKKILLSIGADQSLMALGVTEDRSDISMNFEFPIQNLSTSIVSIQKETKYESRDKRTKSIIVKDVDFGEIPRGVQAMELIKMGDSIDFEQSYKQHRRVMSNDISKIKIPGFTAAALRDILVLLENSGSHVEQILNRKTVDSIAAISNWNGKTLIVLPDQFSAELLTKKLTEVMGPHFLPISECSDTAGFFTNDGQEKKHIVANKSSILGLTFRGLKVIVTLGVDSIAGASDLLMYSTRFRTEKGLLNNEEGKKLIAIVSADDCNTQEKHHLARTILKSGIGNIEAMYGTEPIAAPEVEFLGEDEQQT